MVFRRELEIAASALARSLLRWVVMSIILVPLDFSDCAPHVVTEALRFAEAFRGRLLLLHASDPPRGLPLTATVQPSGSPKAMSVEALLGTKHFGGARYFVVENRGLDVLVHTVAEGYYALLAVPPPAPLHQALDALATAAAALRREMR